jgi:hypothetical protein
MLDAVYKTEGASANGNPPNRTNYGAWNKMTKGQTAVRQAGVLDENRIVLYKRGKNIGKGFYIVEISSNNT